MSYSQGLSGLNAASSQLSVIGNNVANANTVGFKGSEAQFSDAFANALAGGNSTAIGIGVQLQTVAQQFAQGNITATNSALDLAINGAGFFQLSNAQGTTYSRNGQFQLNSSGYIVNAAGEELQGYAIIKGVPSGSPTALMVPTGVANAQATGAGTTSVPGIIAGLNLNSTSLPSTSAFNPVDPTTYNNFNFDDTYDSKGVAQITTMYFAKASSLDTTVTPPAEPSVPASGIVTDPTTGITTVTPTNPITNLTVGGCNTRRKLPDRNDDYGRHGSVSGYRSAHLHIIYDLGRPFRYAYYGLNLGNDVPNTWNVYTTVTDPTTKATLFPSPAPTAGNYIANGILTFNPNGSYAGFVPNTNNPNTAAANAAAGVTGPDSDSTSIILNPTGAATETIPFSFATSTQFGTPFGVNSITQDGYTAGQLSGFTISTDGIISGNYSNGQTNPLGQVVLATFPNDQGLEPVGNNGWTQTAASGTPVTGAPGTGNNGTLQTSSTEDSNVDLTTELVDMMTAQRYYQANAQTIKTQDTVIQTLINLR